jgi:hypothetical protein
MWPGKYPAVPSPPHAARELPRRGQGEAQPKRASSGVDVVVAGITVVESPHDLVRERECDVGGVPIGGEQAS